MTLRVPASLSMHDLFALDQRKSKHRTLSQNSCFSNFDMLNCGFCNYILTCFYLSVGAAKWRGAVHALGLLMAGAGILLMLLTAWKSFGAAEFEGQVGCSRPAITQDQVVSLWHQL